MWGLGFVWLLMWIFTTIGWCMNLYKLVSGLDGFSIISNVEIVRIIGLFVFPLGAVMGWFV